MCKKGTDKPSGQRAWKTHPWGDHSSGLEVSGGPASPGRGRAEAGHSAADAVGMVAGRAGALTLEESLAEKGGLFRKCINAHPGIYGSVSGEADSQYWSQPDFLSWVLVSGSSTWALPRGLGTASSCSKSSHSSLLHCCHPVQATAQHRPPNRPQMLVPVHSVPFPRAGQWGLGEAPAGHPTSLGRSLLSLDQPSCHLWAACLLGKGPSLWWLMVLLTSWALRVSPLSLCPSFSVFMGISGTFQT